MAQVDLFPSFWMAGFDCASQVQRGRGRLDQLAATQHDRFAADDYAMLAPFGIRTVRDGARWHLIERQPGHFDFSPVEPLLRAAERYGLLVIWDICHFGWPDDVDPLRPDFPDRYARFARAFAQFIHDHSAAVPCYVPIVEITFLAMAAGENAIFAPFARGRAVDVRRNLIRAAVAGIEAIWGVDKRARIIFAAPLTHVVAPLGRPDLSPVALIEDRARFLTLDLLAGRMEPELGGHPRYLDILGFDFYPHSETDTADRLLPRADPRWIDLSDLLDQIHARYERPLFISETSAKGPERAAWIEYVAGEAARCIERDLPLRGLCLYPITNTPNWDTGVWEPYGLWDLEPRPDGTLARVLNEPAAAALRAAQAQLQPYVAHLTAGG